MRGKGADRLQNTKRQSFLHGAVILSAATALVKLIGAVYKIPIANLMTEEAAGQFKVAYDIYSTLFVIATAGLPVAISKMVSEAEAARKGAESRRIFRVALATFLVIGVAGAAVLFFGATAFAEAVNNAGAADALRVIAPAVFFVAVMCAYRGYYQGQGNMVPTAVSQIIEAGFKLVVGLAAVYFVVRGGGPSPAQAAAAMTGVTCGTVFGMVYMILTGRKNLRPQAGDSGAARSGRTLFGEVMKLSIPVTISASVLSLTNLMDSALALGRLQEGLGITEKASSELLGVYSYAVYMFNLPPAFILTLAVSIIPAIAAARAKGDSEGVNRTILSSTRITALLALPAAGGLCALSYPIIRLLYGSRSPEVIALAGSLLFTLGFAILFVCLVSLTNSMLQSLGLVQVPIVTMVIGGAVKLLCNWLLVGNPAINIHGAPIGTLCCYAVIALLNLAVILRVTRVRGLLTVFAKPLLATAGLVGAAYGVHRLLQGMLGSNIACVVAIGFGALTYFTLIFALRGIAKEDLLMMPKGEKLAKFLRID
jgi:stage V sporulation protein B